MAKGQTRRLKPDDIGADTDSFDALKIVTGYVPANQNYTVAKVQALFTDMTQKQTLETQAETVLKTAKTMP